MSTSENSTFVPILTVMVDYGNAPFLWRVTHPDQAGIGGNLCDGAFWDESFPMSEGLWRKFSDWAVQFDRTAFYADDFNADDWDWPAFHRRGLQLSLWLKEEVRAAHRVVYNKPFEDPNHRIDERTEILVDGTLLPLPALPDPFPEPRRFCQHIVSGGQTGADRAALDFAMRYGYTHGGWAPHGRVAEDGEIPARYQLVEMAQGGYRQRTRRNVEDSDATLIVNLGELNGGTRATHVLADRSGKPCLVVQVDYGISGTVVESVVAWLHKHRVNTLNVAGPRESKRPGVHRLTGEMLLAVDKAFQLECTG